MDALFCRQIGNGSPIVLLHGFCENHHIWDGFADELAKNHMVILFDLPGFGSSNLSSDSITIDGVGELITDKLNQLQIVNPIVIGHSLGGYVALAMVTSNPLKFAGLVLFHSTPYADSTEKKENRNKTINFVESHGVAPFVDTFVPSLFKDKTHQLLPFIREMALSTPLKTIIAYSKAMRDRVDRGSEIAELNFPLLVLAGAYDSFIPLPISKEIAKLSTRGILQILENAAHMGMLEDQEVAINAIQEFARHL